MDPLIGSTVLSVGGSLLGGLFGDRSAKKAAAQQRAWALEDQSMQWVRHREASERGGFNPLATLGMGQGVAPTPVSSNNYMGEAIAQSALILGENLAKTQAANKGRQVEDLRRQRDILTRRLTNATIRPTVPGVFQRAQAFGTGGVNAGTPGGNAAGVGPVRAGGGNGSVVPPAGSVAGLRPLETTNPVDPRRTVEVRPISSTSGFMTVDNPYLPVPLRAPTLDGEEPLQWYDYPSLAIPGAIWLGEMAYNAGRDYSSERGKQRLIESYNPRGLKRSLQPHTLRFNPNRADAYYRPGFQ